MSKPKGMTPEQEAAWRERQRERKREAYHRRCEDPANRERQSERWREAYRRRCEDPANRERERLRSREAYHRRREDPANREARREAARRSDKGKVAGILSALCAFAGIPETCALCGADGTVLDHEHATETHPIGFPRGPLCHPCNTTLGIHERGRRAGRAGIPDWADRADRYLADPPIFAALRRALEGR